MSTDEDLSNPAATGGGLDEAMRDLGFAVKSLQLYPSNSPVVQQAIDRSFASLLPIVRKEPLVIEVGAAHLRASRDEQVGAGMPVIEQLAARLHGHGVARLFLTGDLDRDALQELAELAAIDRKDLDADGGFEWILQRRELPGVRAEMLELQRLFEETDEEGRAAEDIWDALLQDFATGSDGEPIDWSGLARRPERLRAFVDWMRENLDKHDLLGEVSEGEAIREVLGRVGGVAMALGSEHINFLVLAVREMLSRLEPSILAEVLAEPIELESQDDSETVDLTREVAAGLETAQTEGLVLECLRHHEGSSRRLYGMLNRLLGGREERQEIARRVRTALESEMGAAGRGKGDFLSAWPRLNEVLLGEAPDRFVNPGYRATLERVTFQPPPTEIWPLDRLRPRIAELERSTVMRRKSRVLLSLFDEIDDEDEYRNVALSLERTLPELIVEGDFEHAERILKKLTEHSQPESTKSPLQRRTATGIVERFFVESRLEEILAESLRRREEDAQVALRVFFLAGADRCVPVLMDALAKETSAEARRRLVRLLSALGDRAAAKISRRLQDERWYFVRNLVLIIGEIGDRGLIGQLAKALRHEEPRVRHEAVNALIKIGGTKAATLLQEALDDHDRGVKLRAIHGLGYHRSHTALEALPRLLALPNWRGQNTDLLRTACVALGRLGDPGALAALEPLTRKPWFFRGRTKAVREAADWAVRILGGEDVGPAPELAWLRQLRPKGMTAAIGDEAESVH